MTDALGTFAATDVVSPRLVVSRARPSFRLDRDGALIVPISGQRRVQLIIKRGVDVVGGIALLVLLAPLLAAIALAIRATSQGPALFRQVRHGLNGEPFEIIKFRTLYAERCDADGVNQTTIDDDRVTGVGRFLRRWNLDELPQLFNVIGGTMSLVGPRPHVPGMLAAGVLYEELVPYYFVRLAMKPGITGWAQCNGLRGPTDQAELAIDRVDHDIHYIQNYSLWLDFKCLIKTICRECLGGTGV